MRWRSYVAVGDSFTEGMNDIGPGGRMRGWADLVASRLAVERAGQSTGDAATSAVFQYANLAVRGRLFQRIVDEQVPVALQMQPQLVSFAGGGNDVLRRNFDPEPMLARFNDLVRDFRATGADVVIFRWVDVSGRLPGRRVILPRTQMLNDAVARTGEQHGAIVVDLWADDEFQNPLLWSDDRLHMSSAGHRRVAGHVLTKLGLEPDPSWLRSPGEPPRLSWPVARAQDLRWAREHLAPWVKRRLTGRSSGDIIGAKRPTLAPFPD
jgi:lysophospholipase L1-like esterase